MSLVVLEPGLASRIVDIGRPRSRSLGVPVGGAADRRSLALGNALVGNPDEAAALEIALQGPHLRADTDVACVVFGAPFEMIAADRRLPTGQTFTLAAGTQLKIGAAREGMRAYVCVRGGFQGEQILGSFSGLDNIVAGAVLECPSGRILSRFSPELQPMFPKERTLRVLSGLQADWFEETEFLDQAFRVSPASNRMGLRLLGQALTMPGREMISEAVCPGTVQVTREGQCIVLGVDGQTIGGYPKIVQVIQADLDILGQIRPGETIRFSKIAMNEAVEHNLAAAQYLREWTTRLRLSLDA